VSSTTDRAAASEPYTLSPQQVRFFEAFGFLHLKGLFADDIGDISAAFEEVFSQRPDESDAVVDLEESGFREAFSASDRVDSYHHLNFGGHRAIIPHFIERHPTLAALKDDPRISGIVNALMGPNHEDLGTDGNLFDCDTAWHCDVYNSPLEQFHIKLLFYLDPLDGRSGALRVIPGTNHHNDEFARKLRRDLNDWEKTEQRFGVDLDGIPAHVVSTVPGDLIVASFRTIHATLHGRARRRLFTLNYRQLDPT